MRAPNPTGGYTGQSAVNQDAADGGYWHQRVLIEALLSWRSSELGARLALALFGSEALGARALGAEPMDDPSCKPDLLAWLQPQHGGRVQAYVSAKLSRLDSTSDSSRPMHHAGRARFEEAHLHGLLPEHNLEARAALLEHFVDGEPLARQDESARDVAMTCLRASWPLVAHSAICGLKDPRATHLVISVARARDDGSLELAETRCMLAHSAVSALGALAPELTDPREGQVGTLGNRLMHIQRGQALSLGAQRDIQTKINAGALFKTCSPLPPHPRSFLSPR